MWREDVSQVRDIALAAGHASGLSASRGPIAGTSRDVPHPGTTKRVPAACPSGLPAGPARLDPRSAADVLLFTAGETGHLLVLDQWLAVRRPYVAAAPPAGGTRRRLSFRG